ncbi:NEL-type E3 ubiquitin ligase domain-containing protein [Pseudomonas sp. PSKL.D1]|uniref:NEL-type E3 ubiquitin ligase domain-containing protein n=1 Tax=Pseudomonas sp. PSKL.D1 TaxID=3029060 RepID=UPI002381565A|nr:NEL-type E3 ubiquitin ligase domain-containing protein [Pseudomonas sp. PSKL.D1]WDY56142.1 NEL-type E3 ubiquitin ligase domain-containing protein [Pseudomonas sp. PSKL.D1]
MPEVAEKSQPEVDTLAVAQAYQDQLIAKRLPDWVSQLNESEFTALSEALRQLLRCNQQLSVVFAQVRNIDDFARPLLNQALDGYGHLDVDALYFRKWYVYEAYTSSYFAGRVPVPDSDYYDLPLIEAALYNFTAQEQSEQPRHNGLVDTKGVRQAGLSAVAFAKVCRDLDVGQRYQEHLSEVLVTGQDKHDVRATLAQFQRSSMLADAVQAKAQGVLSGQELQLIIGLCRDGKPGTLAGAPVHARQLKIFGCPLQHVVVLDVIDVGVVYNSTKRVLVYVPADPEGAWSACDDLEDYARRVLGMRLRQKSYRQFFSRFVRRRESHKLFAAVNERLNDVADWATRDLDEQTTGYPLPLFEHLADAWVAQIKDDAAIIAPPVAQLDRQAQAEHDRRLMAEGWTLLAIAGLYMPAIGAVMAAVMVYELLEEAYQAITDWQDDEHDAALEHLLTVGKQVVLVGATAASVAVVRRAWSQVDTLISARLEGGSEKLWNGDLQPYHSESPPAAAVMDEQGIYRQGSNHWIEIQNHWYRIIQDNPDAPWRLMPYRGHSPQLRHNGAGAWRLWHEQPAEWTDARMMFRRLGRPYSGLDDLQVDQVMAIHGLDIDHLRALHVYQRRAEAGMADTVTRLLLAGRIRTLIDQLQGGQHITDTVLLARAQALAGAAGKEGRALADVLWSQRRDVLQSLYEEMYTDAEGSEILRRDFASLHRLAADEVLRMASAQDRQTLLDTQRVPLQMAQMARSQVQATRVARVREALIIDTPQTLDLARVSLKLLARLPQAASLPGWRLFDGDSSQPLLTIEGAGTLRDLVHHEGRFTLLAAQGEAQAEGGELFASMAMAYSAPERALLGLTEPAGSALRAHLATEAERQHQHIAGWLGIQQPRAMFLAPLRLDEARVGYPLSGGRFWATLGARSPRALQARLRDLFPAFSDEQIGRWLQAQEAPQRLEALERQYDLLTRHLNQWVRNAFPTLELFARRDFRRGLVDCWRWLVPEMEGGMLAERRFILSQTRSRLQQLPSIPQEVSFPHISILAIRAMRMEIVPDEFLRAFPNLRSLEITNCRLTRLPLPQAITENLEVLDLSGNQIVLDEGQALVLASCSSLVYLNLSNNPLGRSFSIFGMPRLNALLLNRSQLDTFPYGVLDSPELHTLDLRDNGLYELPDGLHESGLWRTGRVNLHGNLLDAPSASLSIWHWLEESRVPYRLRWLDVLPISRRDDMAALWVQLEAEHGAADFFSTMAALTSSGNFKSAPLARNFSTRLLKMFEYMERDDVLKRELFENAAVANCQDNATIRFSDLELRVLVWRARHGELAQHPERALLHLGGQLWRMNVLDQVAAEHAIRVGAGSESIEFALAYRIQLRAVLDLPIEQDDMLYFGIPNLNAWDINQARRMVLAAQTVENLAQYMARQPFWQDYLKSSSDSRLQVPESYHDELERLMALGDHEHEIALLHIDNQQREHEVLLQLTREAMGRAGFIPGYIS